MMKRLLATLTANRRVLILGFGKEGQSTFRYLRNNFPALKTAIADRDEGLVARTGDMLREGNIALHLGDNYLDCLPGYELIIKSPGVKIPETVALNGEAIVTSQTRLVLEAYHRQITGITGTKGKSTTTSLTHHLLNAAGLKTILVGNIGLPPFDYLDLIDQDTRIVYEMSSHQLEDSILAPHHSVLLNLFPEHLDRYNSLEEYYGAKMRILYGQAEGDTFIYNGDIPGISERLKLVDGKRKFLSFSSGLKVTDGCYISGDRIMLCREGKEEEYIDVSGEFPLKGQHNRMNMMAAILAARQAGADDPAIKEGLRTFKGLEHRLEYVGCFRGIHFYNDSIATIPEATIAAIRTLPDTDTLILGGFDRMLDYTAMIDFLISSPVRNFIFLGKAGLRMYDGFRAYDRKDKNLLLCGSLEHAFGLIEKHTIKGKICLLSPAAASYDSFRNFEERGNLFKKIAGSL